MFRCCQSYGGTPFQTVGVAEWKRRAAVLVRDLDTVSKSISTDLTSRRGTYGKLWFRCASITWLIEPVCFTAQDGDLERNAASEREAIPDYEEDLRCAADVWLRCRRLEQAYCGLCNLFERLPCDTM